MTPLEGVTVVALEQAVAGPLATRHLADLGARVIKVERPDGGDFARRYDTAVRGMGSHFVWLNRSKESVSLDLKRREGRDVLNELVARADIFLQNLAPGAAARLGFDAATLVGRHPRLVGCDLSGYGDDGPYRDKRAYDLLVQAESGLVSVTGTPDHPAKAGIPAADIATGMYAYSSILAGLLQRDRTGRGTAIEVTMLEALAEWLGHQVYTALYTATVPSGAGLSHPVICPYDAYPTCDGHQVVVGVQNDREWGRLAVDVLGRPELASDPDFATNVARVRHRARVDSVLTTVISTLTAEEAIDRLVAAGIAHATINTVGDLVAHEQLEARDRWRRIPSPVGELHALLPPGTLGAVAPTMGAVPALGEHSDRVLGELGYDPAGIARLRTLGVLGPGPEGPAVADDTDGAGTGPGRDRPNGGRAT
ncbi:MAG TPA: CaiB/BaiF CoA-transferase family protein [Acidimicrobiales bacterium]|nr:CaiB/BaiF CoA-transferase family protein [Acidimicrobiales bacterium]